MTAMVLRPRAPRRFRRPSAPRPVEELTERLAALARERQRLRVDGASAAALERNRIEIARTQWELSYSLIARHVESPAAAAA